MSKQSNIQLITSILDGNPVEGGVAGIDAMKKAYPYFVPLKYQDAKQAYSDGGFSKELLTAIQPYQGDWLVFCDFLNGQPAGVKATDVNEKQAEPVVVKEAEVVKAEEVKPVEKAVSKPIVPPKAENAIIVEEKSDRSANKQEVKEAIKIEAKTEVKPEGKSEVKPAVKPAEIKAAQPMVKPIEQKIIQPVVKAAEVKTEVPVAKPIEVKVEKTEVKAAEPVVKAVEVNAEVPIAKPVEVKFEKTEVKALEPVVKAAEVPVVKPVEIKVEKIEVKAVEPVAKAAEVQVVKTVDVKVEKAEIEIVEAKVSEPVVKAVEVKAEMPVEKPVEVKVEKAEVKAVEAKVTEPVVVKEERELKNEHVKEEESLITPVYSQDYFLHKGERVSEDIPDELDALKLAADKEDLDKSLMVVMSFSEWLLHFKHTSERQQEEVKDQKALKTMWQKEKLAAAMEEENEEIPEKVFAMAVNSISKEDGVSSETLADIYIKQGKYDQAIEMYRKLSLRNPQKSTYFARKIEEALKNKQT